MNVQIRDGAEPVVRRLAQEHGLKLWQAVDALIVGNTNPDAAIDQWRRTAVDRLGAQLLNAALLVAAELQS